MKALLKIAGIGVGMGLPKNPKWSAGFGTSGPNLSRSIGDGFNLNEELKMSPTIGWGLFGPTIGVRFRRKRRKVRKREAENK